MQIRCPHCQKEFDLSKDVSDDIRQQVRTKEFEDELETRLSLLKDKTASDMKLKISEAVTDEREKYEELLRESEKRLATADAQLQSKSVEFSLALKEKEMDLRSEYESQLRQVESEKDLAEKERDYYRDLKMRMSTKMIGETLEQHCENEFNKIRMAAFPSAEFGKDNEVSKESKSKGDYIFREFDEDGIELISIMFEMKNEMETTATKHKNEHFFKELNKDRNEKGCEYAVLVSMLEADSDLYNQGIVDVSYAYPKMYVIRPQFFIPMITLLRNAALNSHEDRRELVKLQHQDMDMAVFKENFDLFKKGFGYNYVQAHKRLDEAVAEIDKAIARLQAARDALTASDKQISQANKKVDDVTVEKLCKGTSLLERKD